RVSAGLLDALTGTRLPVVMVLHANHPNEIDTEVTTACAELRGAGITLLNQAVLLREINDSPDTLCRLSEVLFDAGILPYYLHMLDRVAGASHFEVDESVARSLLRALQSRLPGYLVPRFVCEIPGAPSKVLFV
ncbi:MAG: EF-P beta-lysylation protein EpmB, partial [Gammaproteobacteria bacterium]